VDVSETATRIAVGAMMVLAIVCAVLVIIMVAQGAH
jgi:hypothetical protein